MDVCCLHCASVDLLLDTVDLGRLEQLGVPIDLAGPGCTCADDIEYSIQPLAENGSTSAFMTGKLCSMWKLTDSRHPQYSVRLSFQSNRSTSAMFSEISKFTALHLLL